MLSKQFKLTSKIILRVLCFTFAAFYYSFLHLFSLKIENTFYHKFSFLFFSSLFNISRAVTSFSQKPRSLYTIAENHSNNADCVLHNTSQARKEGASFVERVYVRARARNRNNAIAICGGISDRVGLSRQKISSVSQHLASELYNLIGLLIL